MPVRSLNSSVLVWPTRAEVDRAVRRWADDVATTRTEVRRIGYFGSYARGDWGVGSDLDVVIVVSDVGEPRDRRALSWDATALPVPADLVIYTDEEWRLLQASESRFARMLRTEPVWVIER